MERRRLAVLAAHLSPPPHTSTIHPPWSPPLLSPALSSSSPFSGDDRKAGPVGDGADGKGCIFCMIVHGRSPAFKLYEDEACLCLLDSHPLTPGHSLVIPKSHFPSLEATPPSVIAAMFSKVPFLSKAIMKATSSDSFNLVVNNGAAAGQVIYHTHLHIIPRKSNDQLWTSQTFKRKPLKVSKDTLCLADNIREKIELPVSESSSHSCQEPKLVENLQDQ